MVTEEGRPSSLTDYAAVGLSLMALVGAVLAAILAAVHNAQHDDLQAYRDSLVMLPELGSLLCSCGNQPLAFIGLVVLLARKRWRLAAVVALAGVVSFALACVAIWLDSSTLLYAT